MCIIIYKPKGKVLDKSILERCYHKNSDSWGFMYAEDNKICIDKNTTSFKNFWKRWKAHQERQAVLHFRIKTRGLVNKKNAHPYLVTPTFGFAHNGTLSCGTLQSDKSDSLTFMEEYLVPLTKEIKNFHYSETLLKVLDEHIKPSRMVFMFGDGRVHILGESRYQACWNDGIWYSNDGFKERKAVVTPFTGSRTSEIYPATSALFLTKCYRGGTCVCKSDLEHMIRSHGSCGADMFTNPKCRCKTHDEHEVRTKKAYGFCRAKKYFSQPCRCHGHDTHFIASLRYLYATQDAEKQKLLKGCSHDIDDYLYGGVPDRTEYPAIDNDQFHERWGHFYG